MMAYEVIGDVQETDRIQHHIFPTIFIGLGGTGKEILMRLRKRFVEHFGDLEDFPLVAYRIIDTDHGEQISGEVITADPFYEMIKFKDKEKIQMNVMVSQYYDKLHVFPHIKQWLTEHGAVRKLGDLGKGAGQIRLAARLAFFHNYNYIVTSLNNAKSQVKAQDVSKKMEKFGLTINSSITYVYIINSLAGGTGSGIFIDLAFLIKQSFTDTAIIGINLLPNVFRGLLKEDRPFANGYASLKELEYYQLSHHFNVNWSGNRVMSIAPPPCDYTYLVDGTNFSGTEITNPQYIYEIVSDNLFLEFSQGDFAARRRSVRINKIGYLQNLFVFKHRNFKGEETMPELFSCRYSSFGISSISYPADRIINACACKFAVKLIDYWGASYSGTIDIRNYLLQEFLYKLQLLEGETTIEGEVVKRNDFLNALYKHDPDSGKTFEALIAEYGDKIKNNIENKLHESENKTISQYIRAKIAEFDALWKDSPDSAEWGEYIRLINQHKRNFLNEGKKKIEEEARRLANREAYGVAFAMAVLEDLKKALYEDSLQYKPRFQREEVEISEEIPRAYSELDDVIVRISRVEKGFWAGLKKQTLHHLVEESFTVAFKNYYTLKLKHIVRKLSAELCNDFNEFLGYRGDDSSRGLIGELNQLLATLQRIRSEFERKYNYFKERKENDLVILLYNPDNVDTRFYPAIIGTDRDEKDLIKEHSVKLMALLGKKNVDELIGTIPRWEIFETQIITYTRRIFSNIPHRFDALNMLYEEDDARQKVERLFNNGKTWIQGADIAWAFQLKEGQKTYYIGLNMKNLDKFSKFQRDMNSIVKGENIQYFQMPVNSEIVFYSEINGFVLSYLQSINEPNGYRERYVNTRINENECELHTNKNSYKYHDIVMLDDEQRARRENSIRAFLLGTILGVIEVEEDRIDYKTIEYIYKARRWIVKPITDETKVLGIEERAIEDLYEDKSTPPWRVSINDEINEKREELKLRGFLPEYAVVLKYHFENVFKITEIDVAGRAKQKKSSIEHDILEEEFKKVSEQLVPESERKNFSIRFKDIEPKINYFTRTLGDKNKRVLDWQELGGAYAGAPQSDVQRDTKQCPVCAREIKSKARRCKFCKSDLEQCDTCGKWLKKGASCPACATETCPYCDELITKGEIICPHCKADLSVLPVFELDKEQVNKESGNPSEENITYMNCPACDERIPDNVSTCPVCDVQIK
jgi:hypothetical protein